MNTFPVMAGRIFWYRYKTATGRATVARVMATRLEDPKLYFTSRPSDPPAPAAGNFFFFFFFFREKISRAPVSTPCSGPSLVRLFSTMCPGVIRREREQLLTEVLLPIRKRQCR
jgi:hypothetical protein